MTEGWRRGARGIDGNKGTDFLTRKAPFEKGADRHDISTDEMKSSMAPWEQATWKVGKVSKGGPPRRAPKGDAGTKP